MKRAYRSLTKMMFAGAAALTLAGCIAAAPLGAALVAAPQPDAPEKSSAVKPAAAPGNPVIGTLAPRKLAAGECGMFLWSKASERNLVFFTTRGGAGQIILNGREVQLTRAAADGAEVLGQFESQTFRYEQLSIELQIQFERRPGLARGAIIPQGALRLKRDDGWEYILPVGGLVGCEGA